MLLNDIVSVAELVGPVAVHFEITFAVVDREESLNVIEAVFIGDWGGLRMGRKGGW